MGRYRRQNNQQALHCGVINRGFPGDKPKFLDYSFPMREIFIVGKARTALGGFQGALSSVPAPKLGATAIEAALTNVTATANGGVITLEPAPGKHIQFPLEQVEKANLKFDW